VTERHPACGRLLNAMGGFWITSFAGMAVLPGLIGVFVGAPLVAHDFETGAYRFGLAQGVSWRRLLVVKMLVIGAIVLIGSCLLGLLTMWCLAPRSSRCPPGRCSTSAWACWPELRSGKLCQPWPRPWRPQ